MIQMKYMLAVFQKIPFYYNIPSKHAKEKCLNADFLTSVQGVQKKCMFEVDISSSLKQRIIGLLFLGFNQILKF